MIGFGFNLVHIREVMLSAAAVANVLDKGYVRLCDHMGNDLSIVNAARVSFAKESQEFGNRDDKLVKWLINRREMSPFRHVMFTFEVKAPLMVARQWWKYVVGSDHTMDAWNEVSRRYVTMEPEFYVPQAWRSAPENKKQGSGEVLASWQSEWWSTGLKNVISIGMEWYRWALGGNVAPEMARGFLPAYFMYTIWRWTASAQSVLWFLEQRLEDKAQYEINQYAQAVAPYVQEVIPKTWEYWNGARTPD